MDVELKALAERCEKATGPDRELDAAIASTFSNSVESDDGDFWWGPYNEPPVRVPDFTGSLDAAMSLVPDGWDFSLHANDGEQSRARVYSSRADSRWSYANKHSLALCAAALRVRATQGETNNV